MEKFKFTVSGLYAPKRIDAFLAAWAEGKYSRSELKRALDNGAILLNGKTAKPRILVQDADVIEGEVASSKIETLSAEKRPLEVIYEDDWLLVIDKPPGLVVHPGSGNKSGTMVNALLGKGQSLSDVGGGLRPGIVHRLDKDTSGLIVVAKNNEAHRFLQAQFADRTFSKTYYTLVKGRVEFDRGRILEPIGRHPKIRQKMAVVRSEEAREAETHYTVIKRFKYATLLEIKLLTGRTHQIRVHMTHLGYPVIGDELYGSKGDALRQMLHAAKIEFIHPKSRKSVRFESPLPPDFKEAIENEERK